MNKTSDHIHALSIIHHKGIIMLLVSLGYSLFSILEEDDMEQTDGITCITITVTAC